MEHPENNPEYAGLTVNSGVGPVTTVNPHLNRNRFVRRRLTAGDYVEGILKGDITILGQAVTLVESTIPERQAIAQEVIEKCLPYSGNSVRVGISGVPGAGKSTSIDEFGIYILKEYGGRLAVLAIDPAANAARVAYLETRRAWRNSVCIRTPSSVPAHLQAVLAVLPAIRARPSSCAKQLVSTRFS